MGATSAITIKGRLTFTPEGSTEPIDCGETEFVLNLTPKSAYANGGLIPRSGVLVNETAADYIIPNSAIPKSFGDQVARERSKVLA